VKHEPVDKYTVAWFKLAECIARREKERALGVYRLLAHSFEDHAYRHQLEGDILYSFHDDAQALDTYKKAISLYIQDGRVLQAVALYEHIIGISFDPQLLGELIALCESCSLSDKKMRYQEMLVERYIQSKNVLAASALLQQMDKHTLCGHSFHIKVLCALMALPERMPPLLLYHVEKAIDGLVGSADEQKALQQLLAQLEHTDSEVYEMAITYLKNAYNGI
jgi:tetratricopeptide (TPR) repeat protein